MPKAKTPPKGKGLLAKKIGPVPVVALIAVAGLLLLLLWRRNKQTTSATGIDTTSTVTPTRNLTPQQASAAGATTPPLDTSALTGLFSTPPDYVNQTDLNTQLDALRNDVGATVAGITFPTPTINVQLPQEIQAPVQAPAPAPQRTNTIKVASTPTKYFTYKKNVTLAHGQTVHFTKGKGYYAA